MIAAELDAHPRDVWSPDAENYFKRLPAGMLDALWDELVPEVDGKDRDSSRFRSLKKAKKAQEIEALFQDMSVREALGLTAEENARIDRYVPPEIAWPHLLIETEAPQKSAPKSRKRGKAS